MQLDFLAPGERIVYRTRHGGDVVVVSDPKSKAAHRADCEACRTQSLRAGLEIVRSWAVEHAAACTALPEGYVDCYAAAIAYAEQASALLDEVPNTPTEQRQERVAQADVCARLSATYAELAGHQNARLPTPLG